MIIYEYEKPTEFGNKYAMSGVGAFRTKKEYESCLKNLKIKLKFRETKVTDSNVIKIYTAEKIVTNRSFWKKEEVKNLKKVVGLSNGSKVDCYIHEIDDINVEIYRPNPNAKEVYNEYNYFNTLLEV